jgi:hypothetical protein
MKRAATSKNNQKLLNPLKEDKKTNKSSQNRRYNFNNQLTKEDIEQICKTDNLRDLYVYGFLQKDKHLVVNTINDVLNPNDEASRDHRSRLSTN